MLGFRVKKNILGDIGSTFVIVHDGNRFIIIYLDDITIFSKIDEDNLLHLRIVFEKCRKCDISLNPKKSLFGLEEGKLLGHIISKYGTIIDPSRVEAIMKIDPPRNKNSI